MLNLKLFCSISILTLCLLSGYGQSDSTAEKKKDRITTEFSVELTSAYIWRGTHNDAKPNIQPSFDAKYKNFTLGFFGSNNLDNTYREFDYSLSYELSGFTLAISDYFCDFSEKFGDYSENSPHLIDLTLEYETGEKHVFGALASCLVWGEDKNWHYNESRGNLQNYSTYIQTSYTLNNTNQSYTFLIGGTTHNGLYSSDLNITNIGFEYEKELQLTSKYNCTPKFGIWINPSSNILLFNCGVQF